MKYLLVLLCIYLAACSSPSKEVEPFPTLSIERIDTFLVDASVRAIATVDANTVWWAGSNGLVGHTKDGGKNWQLDSIKFSDKLLHFRSIALTEEAVFVLSIESPALVYKSVDEGGNWQLVYQEDHPSAFYDAMQFWNDQEGIAMGDPTDGCISIIITRDGGNNWTKVPCSELPAAEEGEAAFAASNSNIALYGDQVWIVTGGKKARVFHSPDKGNTWSVYQSPIVEGDQMTGIYSVDFWDEKQGIIFGGDWNDKSRNTQNKAETADGGKSWQLLADGEEPGYQSCVKYFPKGDGGVMLSVGIPGISISYNAGEAWQLLSTQSWYALSFVENSNECWLAGSGKLGRIVWQ